MFNVVRPSEVPSSLTQKKSYNGADVTQALKEMFYGKCYICETKHPISFNIEHFEAHEGDETKKFDWHNLYYCCARCNNIKRNLYNNLLDCACPETDVFRAIRHEAPRTPSPRTIVIEAQNADDTTQETARLLNSIFNDTHTGNKEVATVELKNAVFKQFAKFFEYVVIYTNEESLLEEKEDALKHLQHFMRKEQEYSAFMRWAVLDDMNLSNLLTDEMDEPDYT